jgi:hypothetical protein
MITEKGKEKIREAYADPSNEDARKLFDWASRQTDKAESEVEQVMRGAKLSRPYVVDAMKELAQLGFGQFVVGRRNNRSRMIWSVNLGDLGRCAQGEPVEFDEAEPAETPSQQPQSAKLGEQNIVQHFYLLRPELRVSLKLPANLTRGEARRLADFILSLPFEDSIPTSPTRDQE